MERLTYDFCIGDNHCWEVKGADNLECREVCARQRDNGCKSCPIAKAFDRLAAYEDTGIEPRAIEHLKLASMGKAIAEITEFEGIPIDRLRELAELDSAGCIPPCKIGDVFYRLWYGFDSAEVNEYRVSMITQKADKSWRIRATDTDSGFQIDLPFDEYVKHAYKTREEAEAALAKPNSET